MALFSSKEAGMAYPHETDDAGVVTQKNPNADNQAGDPVEAETVTGRTNDVALVTNEPALTNTTFTDRKSMAGRKVENKAMSSGDLEDMTKDELIAEAERRGVDVSASWKKAEIIDALQGT